jgi:uncharacterized membrane protein (UPF0127 family)
LNFASLRRGLTALGAVFFVALSASATLADADQARVVIETASGPRAFTVEIADDPQERARGLMHRRELARDAGMLFVYDSPQQATFWMKNTPLPLDILFADEAGVIISIARQTTPFSLKNIPSGGAVRGVLEINGGLSDELGVAEGDRMLHPLFAPGG